MSGMNVLDMSRVVLLVERSHGADLVFFMYSRNVRGALFDRFANAKRQQVLLPEVARLLWQKPSAEELD
jgi:hypothetical protein